MYFHSLDKIITLPHIAHKNAISGPWESYSIKCYMENNRTTAKIKKK